MKRRTGRGEGKKEREEKKGKKEGAEGEKGGRGGVDDYVTCVTGFDVDRAVNKRHATGSSLCAGSQ